MLSHQAIRLNLIVLVGTTAAVCFGRTALAAWTPPIGVPNPGFGIEETRPARPSDWSVAIAGYYYVSEQGGTDSSNPYGTPALPRRSIPNPIPAGSYVEVHGTYTVTNGGVILIRGAGTPESWKANESGPAWVVSQDDTQRAIFPRQIVIYGQFVYVDSINVRSEGAAVGRMQIGSGSVERAADHVVVRNCDLQGNGVSGETAFMVVGRADARITNAVIYRNSIHDYGDMNTTADQDAAPLIVEDAASNIWILENTMHSCTAGLRVGGAYAGQSVDHIYAGRNRIYNVFQAGMAVKFIEDVVFSENEVSDIIDTAWSPAKGIGFQYKPTRYWVLHNTVHDCYNGIRGASDMGTAETPVYIIGNTIYNANIDGTSSYGQTEGHGIEVNGGNSPRYIVNNTIYNVEQGIENDYYAAELIISNNLIQNASNADIFFKDGGTGTKSILRSTLFGSPAKIALGDGVIQALDGIQSTYGKCMDCLEGSAGFTDAAAADFTISSSSDAVDHGIDEAVYDTFEALYGISIRVDAAGIPRPQGEGWDMGAYEYCSGAGPVAHACSGSSNGQSVAGVAAITLAFAVIVRRRGSRPRHCAECLTQRPSGRSRSACR